MSEQPIMDEEQKPFGWEEIERWRAELPRLIEQAQESMDILPAWKSRIFGGAMLMAFSRTIEVADKERTEAALLKVGLTRSQKVINQLAKELRKVEWVMGSDENSYCGWCWGEEPGNKPVRSDYEDDEDFEIAMDIWSRLGHKSDCTRQAILAALSEPKDQE